MAKNARTKTIGAKAAGSRFIYWFNLTLRFGKYRSVLSHHWWLMGLATLSMSGSATWYAFTRAPKYESYSTLGIVPRIALGGAERMQLTEELTSFYDTQLQYMKSGTVLDKVFDRIKVYPWTSNVKSNLTYDVSRGKGGFFQMFARSTDLEFAQLFTRSWAEEFMGFKADLKTRALDKTANAIFKETQRYEQMLEKNRNELSAFQKKHNIASAKEVGDAAQQRLDRMLEEYTQHQTEQKLLESITKEELANALQEQVGAQARPGGNPVGGASNQAFSGPLDKFNDLRYSDFVLHLRAKEAEAERLKAVLKPRHPYMQQLAEDIKQGQEKVKIQLDLIEAKRLALVESLKKEGEGYSRVIDDLKKQVLESRSIQVEYTELNETATRIAATLDTLRRQVDGLNSTAVIDEEIDILEKGVYDKLPDGRPKPAGIRKIYLLIAGVLGGLGFGLGLALLLENLDDRFEYPHDIQAALSVPLLTQVPLLDKRTVAQGPLFIHSLERDSMFAESIRRLRSASTGQREARASRVFLVTSALPGDGKTTIAVNFAAILAGSQKRVLLLDADLRRGNTHRFFGQSPKPGLAEVIQGHCPWPECIRQTEIENLNVMHSGTKPANPGEMLVHPRMAQLISESEKAYDHIIIDCAPLTSLDDAYALLKLVDGMVLVVRSGCTSMHMARMALDQVKERGANVLGVVINGIAPSNPYNFYQEYYHAQYRSTAGETEADKVAV